jgi:cobalt-zinc-cadmium efflux system protein
MASNHQHSHTSEDVSDRVLLWSVIINVGLSVFEFAAGAIAGSVALMADALHNTNDAGALLIAYIARKIAGKAADHDFTFGYRRAELIGAMIQLTALIVVGLYLMYEAVRRFFVPEPLLGEWIMAAAGVALLVDLVTVWLLWAMSKGSLNVRAAFLHNITDAGASVAVLLGGAAVFWLGWNWVDPLLTLVIAGYILWMSFGLLRRTSVILMQGTPAGLSIEAVKQAVETIDGVRDMHHIHIWELDEHRRALEAHIVIAEDRCMSQLESFKAEVKRLLEDKFEIAHSTLELEAVGTDCRAC